MLKDEKPPIYAEDLLKYIMTSQEAKVCEGTVPPCDVEDLFSFSTNSNYQSSNEKLGTVNFETQVAVGGDLSIFVRVKGNGECQEKDEYIDDLIGIEWSALFKDVLHCPMGIDEPYTPGEDSRSWNERVRLRFQKAIPEYPMLSRLWDTYADAAYQSEEIARLRDECLQVYPLAVSNPVALNGLSKLIDSSNKALLGNAGLIFICD